MNKNMNIMKNLAQKIIDHKKWIILVIIAYIITFFSIGAYHFFNPVDRINFTIYQPAEGHEFDYAQLLIEDYGGTTNPKTVLSPRVRVGFSMTIGVPIGTVVEEKSDGSSYDCTKDSWSSCQAKEAANGQRYIYDRRDIEKSAYRADLYEERIRFVKEGTAISMSTYSKTDSVIEDVKWSEAIASLVPRKMTKDDFYYIHNGEYQMGPSSFLPVELKILGIPIYELTGKV